MKWRGDVLTVVPRLMNTKLLVKRARYFVASEFWGTSIFIELFKKKGLGGGRTRMPCRMSKPTKRPTTLFCVTATSPFCGIVNIF